VYRNGFSAAVSANGGVDAVRRAMIILTATAPESHPADVPAGLGCHDEFTAPVDATRPDGAGHPATAVLT
jgi:hypothetical protein